MKQAFEQKKKKKKKKKMTRKSSAIFVGNVVIDTVFALHQFPTEDSKQRCTNKTIRIGGNAFNAAKFFASIKREHHSAFLVAPLSTAFAMPDTKGLSFLYCERIEAAQPESIILVNTENGSRTIVHHRDPLFREVSLHAVLHSFESVARTLRWVHFEWRNYDLKAMLGALAVQRSENGGFPRVSLECESHRDSLHESLWQAADLIVFSHEFVEKSATPTISAFLDKAALKHAMVVITMGSEGAWCQQNGKKEKIAAVKCEAIHDSTGAGDVFIGCIVHNLMDNYADLQRAVKNANSAAAKFISSRRP